MAVASARRGFRRSVGVSAVLAMAGAAHAGPDWSEVGDAGSFFSGAQITSGIGATLSSITGSLSGSLRTPDFEDMYIIRITDPSSFSMRIDNANFNAQLFLFNISLPFGLYGLLSNDDRTVSDNRPYIGNLADDATSAKVTLPGDYAIAVSGYNNDPLSITGQIFGPAVTYEVSGADGPGGFNNHIAWMGGGETGDYRIDLTGVGYPEVPAPGAATLLGMAAGLIARRRRR